MKSKIYLAIFIALVGNLKGQVNNSNPWPIAANVGIGTNTPNNKLELVTNIAGDGLTIKQVGNAQGNGAAGLKFQNSTVGGKIWGLYSLGAGDPAGSGNFAIYDVSGIPYPCRFLINGGTGNVGIGTISPGNNRLSLDAISGDNVIECKVNSNSEKYFQCINKSVNMETFQVWGNGNTVIHSTAGNPTDHAFVIVDASLPNQWVKNFVVLRNGTVKAREIFVNTLSWPDYVFDHNFELLPLDKLESYISKNHHLPNVPTAEEIEKNGTGLGDMAKIQMEKIEELTLYILELKKQLDQQKLILDGFAAKK